MNKKIASLLCVIFMWCSAIVANPVIHQKENSSSRSQGLLRFGRAFFGCLAFHDLVLTSLVRSQCSIARKWENIIQPACRDFSYETAKGYYSAGILGAATAVCWWKLKSDNGVKEQRNG